MVEEVGVATSSDFNTLLCPTNLNGPTDDKGQFSELSNLTGPSPLSGSERISSPAIIGIARTNEEGNGDSHDVRLRHDGAVS